MRYLTSLAAMLAFTSTLAPIADACGWEPPHAPAVHRLSSHAVTGGGPRSFALLGAAPHIDDSAWDALAPASYDGTRIAELAPAGKIELTLVGESGTRVVSAAHRVALDRTWDARGAHTALEVAIGPRDHFAIAVEGRVTGAKWHAAQWAYSRLPLLADTDIVLASAHEGIAVARGGHAIATVTGSVLGALDLAGKRYLVTATPDGDTATVDLGVI